MDENLMVILGGVLILICAFIVATIYNSRRKIANFAEDGLVKAIVPTVKTYRRLKDKVSSELEKKE